MKGNLKEQNLNKPSKNFGQPTMDEVVEKHHAPTSLSFWKKRRLFIIVFFFFVALGIFSLWQYNLYQKLSRTAIGCGGDWSWSVRCPIGSYCRSIGRGPLAGGYCMPWFTTIFDILNKHEQITQDSTFQIEINEMIGGGFMGATFINLINSKGEVYQISSPSWQLSPRKKLVKRIDQEVVKSLRNSLIAANIFEVEEGAPQYSGESWRVIINGQEKTIYFGETPGNLLETEKILKEILEVGDQNSKESTQEIPPETSRNTKTWALIFQKGATFENPRRGESA